ncbi:MAG: SWIM zinc finger family protein [Lachnospiraceae bacterium]|nr:SWIM zinc finger family protein [Lachnospiraceae bacterium]MDE6982778.1 SWIM zinc finger family protein [Lachnospiraceae bacterium]
MSQYWESQVYEQPTEAKIKKNASDSMKKDRKRGKENHPVIIQGRKIVKTWWGEAWCGNLERYADYESRLDRGKRYVRTGAVIDLKIQKGKVLARVQGRRKSPYKVEVRISPVSEEQCQAIIERCGNKVENLETLLNGEFTEDLKSIFLEKNGLFPSSREISFQCSCPDWALMCKHVAAVLYGIGARFDENPLLFFELRGIDVSRFVDVALENKVEKMLENADKKSQRIMEKVDFTSLFGVEL